MKRYISIILVLSLCFSFAACSVNEKKTDEPTVLSTESSTAPLPKPDIETEEFSKDFTDENGRVVYSVKASLPKITGNMPESIAEYLNGFSYGIFEDTCGTAESNIQNAASFIDSQGLENPWLRVLDYEINLSDGHYLSFTVKDRFSMYGNSDVEPTLQAYTFDIIKGEPCSLIDFIDEGYSSFDAAKQVIVDDFICVKVSDEMFDGTPLTDEKREIVHSVFDTANFYLTDTGIGFYFSKNAINQYQFGTFNAHFTWDEIVVVLNRDN